VCVCAHAYVRHAPFLRPIVITLEASLLAGKLCCFHSGSHSMVFFAHIKLLMLIISVLHYFFLCFRRAFPKIIHFIVSKDFDTVISSICPRLYPPLWPDCSYWSGKCVMPCYYCNIFHVPILHTTTITTIVSFHNLTENGTCQTTMIHNLTWSGWKYTEKFLCVILLF
jgi:hypothetical protein